MGILPQNVPNGSDGSLVNNSALYDFPSHTGGRRNQRFFSCLSILILAISSKIRSFLQQKGNPNTYSLNLFYNFAAPKYKAMSILSNVKHIIEGTDIDSLNKEIQSLRTENSKLSAENIQKKFHIDRLDSEAKEKQKKIDDLTTRLDAADQFISSMSTQNISSTSERDFLTQENATLRSQIDEMNRTISNFQAYKDNLLKAQETLKEEKSSLQKERTRLRNRFSELQGEKETLLNTIDRAKSEISTLIQKNNGLTKLLDESTSKDILKGAEIERLNTELIHANTEKEHEKEHAATAKKELSEVRTLYQNLQKDASEEKNALLNQMHESENIRKSLEDKITSLQENNALLITDKSKLELDNALLQSKNQDQEVRIASLEKSNSELTNRLRVTESEIGNLGAMIEELKRQIEAAQTPEFPIVNMVDSQAMSDCEVTSFEPEENSNTQEVEETSNEETTNKGETADEKTSIIPPVEGTTSEESEDEFPEAQEEDWENSTEGDPEIEDPDSLIEEPSTEEDSITDNLETRKAEHINFYYDDDELPDYNEETTYYENDTSFGEMTHIAKKLSIPIAYDIIERKYVKSRRFFSQPEAIISYWRKKAQEDYITGHFRFICPECRQPVRICGRNMDGSKLIFFFAHFKDSGECFFKTNRSRSPEEMMNQRYGLIQESERHKELIAEITAALEDENSIAKGIKNVAAKKRISSEVPYINWRRPDIYAEYNGRKYVFELQISTTFLNVMVEREIFYRLHGINLIWIFNFEDEKESDHMKWLMSKDIYYAHRRNVYFFDNEAKTESKKRRELVLNCHWLDEHDQWTPTMYVTLDMFKNDDEYFMPYIEDADKWFLEAHPDFAEKRKENECSCEELLKRLMERHKKEQEDEKRKEENRTELQQKLLEEDRCVKRFCSGKKFGYQYKGEIDGETVDEIILPAKYTSAEDIREDGYAEVGFNRRKGLVRKDGKEIVPPNFKEIKVINGQHGIVLATDKGVNLWLSDKHFVLCNDYNENKQPVAKRTYQGRTLCCLIDKKTKRAKAILFAFVEKEKFCMIRVGGEIYLLTKQHLFTSSTNNRLENKVDIRENFLAEFNFANLIHTDSEYLIAQSNDETGFYGLIDYEGNTIITPQYKALIPMASGYFIFSNGILWGLCDSQGNVLHGEEYTYVRTLPSGEIGASILPSYTEKWEVEENNLSYNDDDVQLFLINNEGEIIYKEEVAGEYLVRHSGDLLAIYSRDHEELVGYTLISVNFVTEKIAIIQDADYRQGVFNDGKCIFFDEGVTINILDNLSMSICKDDKYALYSIDGKKLTEHIFSSITLKETNRYLAKTKSHNQIINAQGHFIIRSSQDGRLDIVFYENRYGLTDTQGSIIIPLQYMNICFLYRNRLAVKKESYWALFNTEGKALTEFKYSKISCKENGIIKAIRNKRIGGLDDEGNEIASILSFNGGYIKYLYEERFVINDAEDVIYSTNEYTNIILLNNDGIFALREDKYIGIGNIHGRKTGPIYMNVRAIGNDFFSISRTIPRKITTNRTNSDASGNSQTNSEVTTVRELKYGIIDKDFCVIVPCQYKSISKFNEKQCIRVKTSKGEEKSISLDELKQQSVRARFLVIDQEYEATVLAILPVSLIVKIENYTYLIHRIALYKAISDFEKGERFMAIFWGNNKNGFPKWSTSPVRQEETTRPEPQQEQITDESPQTE